MPEHNPLARLTSEWLPRVDFAVLGHGFLRHGRDYEIVVQTPGRGTDRIVLTHVVLAHYETAVPPRIWTKSWNDVFLDYDRASGLDGYVWGTNWSLAYPGLGFPEDDPDVAEWSRRLGRQMHGVFLGTDRFELKLVFAGLRTERLSDATGTIGRVVTLL